MDGFPFRLNASFAIPTGWCPHSTHHKELGLVRFDSDVHDSCSCIYHKEGYKDRFFLMEVVVGLCASSAQPRAMIASFCGGTYFNAEGYGTGCLTPSTYTPNPINQVLALPRPSQCPTPGQLSVDLHLLRRMEALSVLDAVLRALSRHRRRANRQDPNIVPAGQQQRRPGSAPSPDPSDSFTAAAATAPRPSSAGDPAAAGAAAAGHTRPALRSAEFGHNGDSRPPVYNERFSSLEVVVGRGTHSVAGVARLRPCVAAHLARKRLPARAVEGDRGEGVVVVGLEEL